MKHNTPKLLAYGAAAGLFLTTSCTAETAAPTQTPTSSEAPSTTALPPTDRWCDNVGDIRLDGFQSIDNASTPNRTLMVTGFEKGQLCAPLHDENFKDIGNIIVGSTLNDACVFTDKPARMHVRIVEDNQDLVGDINLTDLGLLLADQIGVITCDLVNIPDKGFIAPHTAAPVQSSSPATPTTAEPIPDYCWEDPRFKGCSDYDLSPITPSIVYPTTR